MSVGPKRTNHFALGDVGLAVYHSLLHSSFVATARDHTLVGHVAVASDTFPWIRSLAFIFTARVELSLMLFIVLFA